ISGSGRSHGPATAARATCTVRPGGAKRLNCGSVMLLTEGMIMPMRALAAGGAASVGVVRSWVAVASMAVSPMGAGRVGKGAHRPRLRVGKIDVDQFTPST